MNMNLQTNATYKVTKTFRILLLIFSLLAFGLFIISLFIFHDLAFLEFFIKGGYLFFSILLFVCFKLSKNTEVQINEDRIKKKTFFKSKQIQWNDVGEIFENISSAYPKSTLGYVKIHSKNNDTKIRIDSYMDHFDKIQKIVQDNSFEYIKIAINNKLSNNQKVDFFYSGFYKIGYVVFIITTFILIILPVLLKSINLISIILEIILLYFLIKGVVKSIRSSEIIQLSNDKIVKLTIFRKRSNRLSDIKDINIKGKGGYKGITTINFKNNKNIKIDAKISNYRILLSYLMGR